MVKIAHNCVLLASLQIVLSKSLGVILIISYLIDHLSSREMLWVEVGLVITLISLYPEKLRRKQSRTEKALFHFLLNN